MKVLKIKFLQSGLMQVTKCDGEFHQKEDCDDGLRVQFIHSRKACNCCKVEKRQHAMVH